MQTTNKGATSIGDYFAKIESIYDQLALAAHYVEQDELVMCILIRLSSDYDLVVVALLSRIDEMSFHEVQVVLLSQKAHVELINYVGSIDILNSVANFVSNTSTCG